MSDSEDIGPTPGDLTPYLRLDDVLINYAHTSRDVLDDNFVGLYLLGSLAIARGADGPQYLMRAAARPPSRC